MRVRKISGVFAVAASLTLAVGCAADNGTSNAIPGSGTSGPVVAGVVEAGSLSGKQVTFVGDGGTTQEFLMEAMFTPFAAESGVTFLQDSPRIDAKIQAQVETGNIQWDFVTASSESVMQRCGTLYEELDYSRIDLSKTPEGSVFEPCGVPAIASGFLLVYNTDKYKENPPTGWVDFFNTADFPGKRAVYGGAEPYAPVLEAAAIGGGWDPTTPFAQEQVELGVKTLKGIRSDTILWSTGAEVQQMLESEEADMAMTWNGRALVAAQNGANYTPVWNQFYYLVDSMAMVKGSPNSDAVYAAMNYFLGEQQQATFAELSGYSPLNVDSVPNVDALTLTYGVGDPEKLATSLITTDFWISSDNVKKVTDTWAGLISGN